MLINELGRRTGDRCSSYLPGLLGSSACNHNKARVCMSRDAMMMRGVAAASSAALCVTQLGSCEDQRGTSVITAQLEPLPCPCGR